MTSTVLVTSTSGRAAESLMEALQSGAVRLLACDSDPQAPGLHLVPPAQRFVVHPCDNPEFIGDLLALCVRCNVDVLIPTGDRELVAVACARDVFERMGTRVMLAPEHHTPAKERRFVAQCASQAAGGGFKDGASWIMSRLRGAIGSWGDDDATTS